MDPYSAPFCAYISCERVTNQIWSRLLLSWITEQVKSLTSNSCKPLHLPDHDLIERREAHHVYCRLKGQTDAATIRSHTLFILAFSQINFLQAPIPLSWFLTRFETVPCRGKAVFRASRSVFVRKKDITQTRRPTASNSGVVIWRLHFGLIFSLVLWA